MIILAVTVRFAGSFRHGIAVPPSSRRKASMRVQACCLRIEILFVQNRAVARVVEGRQPLPGLCEIDEMRIGGKKASICHS